MFKNHPLEPIVWDGLTQLRAAQLRRVNSIEKKQLTCSAASSRVSGISCCSFRSFFWSPSQHFKHSCLWPNVSALILVSHLTLAAALAKHSKIRYKFLWRVSTSLNKLVLKSSTFLLSPQLITHSHCSAGPPPAPVGSPGPGTAHSSSTLPHAQGPLFSLVLNGWGAMQRGGSEAKAPATHPPPTILVNSFGSKGRTPFSSDSLQDMILIFSSKLDETLNRNYSTHSRLPCPTSLSPLKHSLHRPSVNIQLLPRYSAQYGRLVAKQKMLLLHNRQIKSCCPQIVK